MPERSLIGANNEMKFLFRIWTDDEIHGQLLVIMQNLANTCKWTKTQSDNRYKLLSLSKMEYFVPLFLQWSEGPLPLKGLGSEIKLQNECNSKFQLHSSVLKV